MLFNLMTMVRVEDFIKWNGGIDPSKFECGYKPISKMMFGKRTDFYGYHTIEEIKDRLVERATPAELKFKELLDRSGVNYVFQKIIKRPNGKHFVVDFYIVEKNMVIEIDGPYHDWPEMQFNDLDRNQILRELGFKVKRLTNDQVERIYSQRMNTVCSTKDFIQGKAI